jgi:hypothetical protein
VVDVAMNSTPPFRSHSFTFASFVQTLPTDEHSSYKPMYMRAAKNRNHSTKPPGSKCDSHHPDKVTYSIPDVRTRSNRAHIEETLIHDENVVCHTTSGLELMCPYH